MARYDSASLRLAADEIEQVANARRITVGEHVAPDDIADEPLTGDDDISGDFFRKYRDVHLTGLHAYHSVDRLLLLSAQGLRTMAETAEQSDSESADNIFHRFAKYADDGGGTDIIDIDVDDTRTGTNLNI